MVWRGLAPGYMGVCNRGSKYMRYHDYSRDIACSISCKSFACLCKTERCNNDRSKYRKNPNVIADGHVPTRACSKSASGNSRCHLVREECLNFWINCKNMKRNCLLYMITKLNFIQFKMNSSSNS